MVEHADRILAWCEGNKSLAEVPPGSNNGFFLRHVLQGTVWEPGEEWCIAIAVAAVAYGFYGFENLPFPGFNTASASALYSAADRAGCLSAYPATGCIALLRGGGTGHYHGGIVQSVIDDNTYREWEGNTNEDGSPEGYMYCEHIRKTETTDFVIW